MVKLTGDFWEEAQEVLSDLHVGIDAGKKIAIATHDFETKLLAIDMLFMHIEFNYVEHEDLHQFFVEISEELVELRNELGVLEKGKIHVVLDEEAAKKIGTAWILKHRKKFKNEIKEEINIDKKILQKISLTFSSLKEKFSQVEHLFEIDVDKAIVKEVKLELKESENEVKHIIERLIGFFITYEKIFNEELNKLKS